MARDKLWMHFLDKDYYETWDFERLVWEVTTVLNNRQITTGEVLDEFKNIFSDFNKSGSTFRSWSINDLRNNLQKLGCHKSDEFSWSKYLINNCYAYPAEPGIFINIVIPRFAYTKTQIELNDLKEGGDYTQFTSDADSKVFSKRMLEKLICKWGCSKKITEIWNMGMYIKSDTWNSILYFDETSKKVHLLAERNSPLTLHTMRDWFIKKQ